MPARPLRHATGLLALLAAFSSCDNPQVVLPASLDTPLEMAISRGVVCMDLEQISDEGLVTPTMRACAQSAPQVEGDEASRRREQGSIGLIVGAESDRVSLLALNRRLPTLVDLELSTPGVTHIPVGAHPVSIATSPDGAVAYSANQLGKSLSVLNVFALAALPEEIPLPGAPSVVRVSRSSAEIVVGVPALDDGSGSALLTRQGVSCEIPAALPAKPNTLDPSQGCTGQEPDAPITRVLLPGTLRDLELDPLGEHAFALYSDRAYLSVVALGESEEACLDGGMAPCEIARIGLTYECSDGVDNDGDGLTDQEDGQCFGPLHAESAGGIGQYPAGACGNGLDDDGDGLIDRFDPDCLDSAQASEASSGALTEPAACSNGLDDDGDGAIDALDADCYGPRGRSESTTLALGFEQLAIDEHGVFLYVSQAEGKQVLIVDLGARALIDAPRSASTPYPFDARLGVNIARLSVPAAMDAHIRRVVTRDPLSTRANTHAVVRYELGAHVVADNGFIYYVDAATVYCDLYETRKGGLLSLEEFLTQPELMQGAQERNCLRVPSLPIQEVAAQQVSSCEAVFNCEACQAGEDVEPGTSDDVAFERCGSCSVFEESAFEAESAACDLSERGARRGTTQQIFNPNFVVRDALTAASARQSGRALCEQPDDFGASVQEYIAQNPRESSISGCGSPLVPQPLALTVPLTGADAPIDFGAEERVSIMERRERRLLFDEDGEVIERVAVNTQDYRVRDETWTIAYEGVLPGTRRTDGLAGSADASVFDVGPLNPCTSDVRAGDTLVIRDEPGTQAGGVPAACEGLVAPAGVDEEFFNSYEITQVGDGTLTLALLEGEAFTKTLPTSACFPRGISYEVRPNGVWVVSGSESGLASGRRRVDGMCVAGNGAPSRRATARAVTGEIFDGPLFSFYLYPGKVAPTRGLSYTVNLERNFASASTSQTTGGLSSIDSGSVRPSYLGYITLFLYSASALEAYDPADPDARLPVPTLQEFLLTIDPSDDSIFVKNISTNDNPSLIR